MRWKSLVFALLLAPPALADAPQVLAARLDGMTLHVTVAHGDTGWDHYADGWRVFAPDGTEIGYRKLLHPHVAEQPFTRSLSGLALPDGASHLVIIAHDSIHGDGPPFELPLQ